MRSLDQSIRDGIALGLGYLTAEDELLGGRHLTLRGRRQVNFGSCSYLGLETDLRLKDAACEAVARYGVQFASSRAYVSCPPYAELERRLTALFATPVVVTQTTTLAHFAALPLLIGKDDAVICDQLVHASVQAVLPTLRAAGTLCRLVRHSRVDRLAELASQLAARHRRIWYLLDGVYSMHGDPAPLDDLRALLDDNEQLHLYVDDSHGVSWSGRHGRGTLLGDGPLPPRTVLVASLAKGFASGGAVLAFPDAETARLVRTCGSTLIFSGPLQPALLGAAIASARIHHSDEIGARQTQLEMRIHLFNGQARARHVPLAAEAATPIRFVPLGDTGQTYRVAAALMSEGFYTNTAVYPAVSHGHGGLRVALTVHQTLDDIRALIDAIAARL
ncbi:MAG TPA: aminotransferase class I/II-fold pyridoxal phosphate-dependent enzyme [Polyangia bacterium]|nr:aminotransferase class I/II-fold pyridoxal phosphate-dependent enzyme [Polyangia bacterium]